MTELAQKLEYCKVCQNRQVDYSKGGLICSLTEEQPTFQDQCETFELDNERQQELIRIAQGRDLADDKNEGASDMLWGAIWCVGGIVATAADIGYIFWGAIVFVGIQFIQGAIKSGS